jgi:hypothetical protein
MPQWQAQNTRNLFFLRYSIYLAHLLGQAHIKEKIGNYVCCESQSIRNF